MKKFKLNFSDEEFLPSSKGIFIKRFSNFKDDSFIYALDEFLTEAKFDGVCYVGEKRGEIPFEYFDQDVWEKSVLFNIKFVICFLSGDDMNNSNKDVKEFEKHIFSYAGTKHYKLLYINTIGDTSGTDEDYANLKELIERVVHDINEEISKK